MTAPPREPVAECPRCPTPTLCEERGCLWNAAPGPTVAQPAEPLGDSYCPSCKLLRADSRGNCRCQQPAEPPAPDDLTICRAVIASLRATVERQAREISLHVAANEGFRERAERAEAELVTARNKLKESGRAKLRAERDALRECVRDMLAAIEPVVPYTSAATQIKFAEVLNAARAKVKP